MGNVQAMQLEAHIEHSEYGTVIYVKVSIHRDGNRIRLREVRREAGLQVYLAEDE